MTRLVIAAVIGLCLLHPLVDAGSDSDDALEIGLREILAGRSPYAVRTHLGNRITPALGGLLVSWPAAIVGAQWLGLIAALLLLRISGGNLLWAMVLLLSGKTLCQGIDYLYGSSLLCWALWSVQQWRLGHAIGQRGRSSCA